MDERIRQRAYEIWLEQGCPEGCDHEHWYRAEREIAALTVPVPPTIEVPAEKPVRSARRAKAADGAKAGAAAAAAKETPRKRTAKADVAAEDAPAATTRKTRSRKTSAPTA
ncbi:DUF2934 domain-containing protein [Azospirillum sp. A39]|uniref:DUF2934 domain-containing protein n=1 Tax=Azospirillum sp. A39 TaxID=3462279 RepID=UPI00404598BD